MYINTTNGRRFCVEAPSETTVHALKLQIMNEVGVPPQHQSLSFGGKALADKDATLASLGLDSNSEVCTSIPLFLIILRLL
jgi:hypothetical protein